MNGPYFAAQLQVAAETGTITVIATDRDNVQHQASASVMVNMLPDSVQLTASPGTGIMTVKQQTGRTTLDVLLAATASISNTVTSYAWDFSGSGSNNLTCYSHSNVTASYQEIGLYLAQVTIRDSSGNEYKNSVIVNVVDSDQVKQLFNVIWNNTKTALENKNIESALSNMSGTAKAMYRYNFTLMLDYLPLIALDMGNINMLLMEDNVAKFEMYTVENGTERAHYIEFIREIDGTWKLNFF